MLSQVLLMTAKMGGYRRISEDMVVKGSLELLEECQKVSASLSTSEVICQ